MDNQLQVEYIKLLNDLISLGDELIQFGLTIKNRGTGSTDEDEKTFREFKERIKRKEQEIKAHPWNHIKPSQYKECI